MMASRRSRHRRDKRQEAAELQRTEWQIEPRPMSPFTSAVLALAEFAGRDKSKDEPAQDVEEQHER